MSSKPELDADAIGYGLKSIVESMRHLKPGEDLAFSRLCDLHTEFSTDIMKRLVRYLESEFLVVKTQKGNDMQLWLTNDGTNALRSYSDRDWWRLGRNFLG